jgi:linearmycin/streptolysin S transport system permease protein
MHQIFTLAGKDLKLMYRDKSGLFFTFFFPIIVAVLFGSIFGSGGDGTRTMNILVVDEDSTAASVKFIQTLDDASEINVIPTDRLTAIDNVRRGKRVAFLAIKEGFGEASEQMFYGDPPAVEIGVDPSRKAEAAMLQGILMKYGSQRFQELFSNPEKMLGNLDVAKQAVKSDTSMSPEWKDNLGTFFGDMDRFFEKEEELNAQIVDANADSLASDEGSGNAFQPLIIEQTDVSIVKTGPKNAFAVTFPQGILWGIIGVAAAFGVSIVVERTQGTMQRLRIAPVSIDAILAGKALACFTAIIAVSIILLLLAFLVFKVPVSSFGLLTMAVISSALCFTGIMMLLSVMGKTERAVGGIGWAVMLTMSMIGGGMVPLMFMPSWMKMVGVVSPVKWAIVSLEGALWRGFSFVEMAQPCGVLLAIGIVTFSIGVMVIRKSELI